MSFTWQISAGHLSSLMPKVHHNMAWSNLENTFDLLLDELTQERPSFDAILKKKEDYPELAISGGGSIFDMLTFKT